MATQRVPASKAPSPPSPEETSDSSDQEKVKEDNRPKVFLDRACFLSSDGRCVSLGYIHLTEDLKEVEKPGGYYGSVRQALQGYVDRVLKGQPSKNVVQLTDLMNKIDATIEKVVPLVCTAVGKKNTPPPAVDESLAKADMEAKRKRSKIVVKNKELKLTPDERGKMLRELGAQYSNVEITPGLRWMDVPDLLAQTIIEAVYNYDPNKGVPDWKRTVHGAVRNYLKTNFAD
jgi:hypothetical protein